MREYEIVDTNAENIGACSLCGNKDANNLGHRRKSEWLKKRYAEGLRFKVLRSREFGDIGVIEYAPGSHAWRPVEAEGYFVIHCLMVNRKHKVPIFPGEFAAPRPWGEDGNRHLRDVIKICEKCGSSRACHAYREADSWDTERSNGRPGRSSATGEYAAFGTAQQALPKQR